MLLKCFKIGVSVLKDKLGNKHSYKGFDRGYDFQQLGYRLCYRWYLSKAETIISFCFTPLLL